MSVSNRRRWLILERDAFTCRYCGRSAPNVILEVDHVLPVSLGGGDEDANLVTACFDCNQGKKARDATEPLSMAWELAYLNRETERLYDDLMKAYRELEPWWWHECKVQ